MQVCCMLGTPTQRGYHFSARAPGGFWRNPNDEGGRREGVGKPRVNVAERWPYADKGGLAS
jgi:hypothetical protein